MYFWLLLQICLCYLRLVLRSRVGVDRLSAWPIIGADIKHFTDIGHFQNIFADNFFVLFFLYYYYYFFIMQTNILFTGDIIYWWLNNTGEII